MSTDPAPNPHATAEQVAAARHDRKLANVLYHDWEAGTYDEKWSISYDERCITYAADRFRLAAGEARAGPTGARWSWAAAPGSSCSTSCRPGVATRGRGHRPVARHGAGRAAQRREPRPRRRRPGGRRRAHPVPGRHVRPRRRARRAAPHPGRRARRCARCCGCSSRAGGSCSRASRPGSATATPACSGPHVEGHHDGHPAARPAPAGGGRRPSSTSRRGRRRWRRSSTSTRSTRPSWKRPRAAPGRATCACVTEEFSAAMLGWPVRTFEAAVPPGKLGMGWAMFAYRGWQRLSWLDEHVLSRVVPRGVVLQRARHRHAIPVVPRIRRSRPRSAGWAVTTPTAADMERPLEPLWRGLLVYRVLTLVSAVGCVAATRCASYASPVRRGGGARRDGGLDRRHGYGYLAAACRGCCGTGAGRVAVVDLVGHGRRHGDAPRSCRPPPSSPRTRR